MTTPTTIYIRKDYTTWALARIKQEEPKLYAQAKTAEARAKLLSEYVNDVLAGHRQSWEDLND